jgi:hypothetical protein
MRGGYRPPRHEVDRYERPPAERAGGGSASPPLMWDRERCGERKVSAAVVRPQPFTPLGQLEPDSFSQAARRAPLRPAARVASNRRTTAPALPQKANRDRRHQHAPGSEGAASSGEGSPRLADRKQLVREDDARSPHRKETRAFRASCARRTSNAGLLRARGCPPVMRHTRRVTTKDPPL